MSEEYWFRNKNDERHKEAPAVKCDICGKWNKSWAPVPNSEVCKCYPLNTNAAVKQSTRQS